MKDFICRHNRNTSLFMSSVTLICRFINSISVECLQEVAVSGSRGKRVNDGEGSGTRPKASKKDLSMNDIEQAVRNGRVILVISIQ